MAGQSMKDSK